MLKNKHKTHLSICLYLPSVAEVYNIHVGLLDVPLKVLGAALLLQVNGED